MIEVLDIQRAFIKTFGETDAELQFFFSPGRVNLIGEHIDYCGGSVLPIAIELGITAAVRFHKDGVVRLRSAGFDEIVEVPLTDAITYDKARGWANYPAGVLRALQIDGKKIHGADILFMSDLPDGAGLSSSAAIEVLTAYIFLHELGGKIDLADLANMCREVENDFIGVQCGVMDQYSIALSKVDSALLLNTRTLEYEYIPFPKSSYSLVIMNTNKRRELAESKYNERFEECRRALEIISQQNENIEYLVDAKENDIDSLLVNETLKNRALHVVSENQRVIRSVTALRERDMEKFARIMVASHASLRDDYEVTGIELDTIVQESLKLDSCIGARMTGAGFGGCAIAFVRTSQLDSFITLVGTEYTKKTGLTAQFYQSAAGGGVRFLEARKKV